MSYADGEALILTAIQSHANFNSSNATRNKYMILNSGNAAYYAITEPGEWRNEEAGVAGIGSGGRQGKVRYWRCEVGVYQRYVDDGDTQADLEEHYEEVMESIEKWRRLKDTTDSVQKVRIIGGPPMEYVSFRDTGGPQWAKWSMYVEWEERRDITLSE